ncbi:hypothetical protein B0H21DRAFT_711753 [Amylocystis lapponica]|nr:hypothetical protein B0H21DRAFT_711753 [Amylocystis lapponica]
MTWRQYGMPEVIVDMHELSQDLCSASLKGVHGRLPAVRRSTLMRVVKCVLRFTSRPSVKRQAVAPRTYLDSEVWTAVSRVTAAYLGIREQTAKACGTYYSLLRVRDSETSFSDSLKYTFVPSKSFDSQHDPKCCASSTKLWHCVTTARGRHSRAQKRCTSATHPPAEKFELDVRLEPEEIAGGTVIKWTAGHYPHHRGASYRHCLNSPIPAWIQAAGQAISPGDIRLAGTKYGLLALHETLDVRMGRSIVRKPSNSIIAAFRTIVSGIQCQTISKQHERCKTFTHIIKPEFSTADIDGIGQSSETGPLRWHVPRSAPSNLEGVVRADAAEMDIVDEWRISRYSGCSDKFWKAEYCNTCLFQHAVTPTGSPMKLTRFCWSYVRHAIESLSNDPGQEHVLDGGETSPHSQHKP